MNHVTSDILTAWAIKEYGGGLLVASVIVALILGHCSGGKPTGQGLDRKAPHGHVVKYHSATRLANANTP